MSLYGYPRLTTPHIDQYAAGGTVFENAFSPHMPTTPGYASMLTGLDCFGTTSWRCGTRARWARRARRCPRSWAGATTRPASASAATRASRGFQKYLDFEGWGSWADGRSHKAENLNEVAIPELKRLAGEKKPFFLFLRHMDPHSPYLPPAPFERMFYGGNECDPDNKSLEPVYAFKPFCDYFASWLPPGCTDKDYVIAQYDGAVAYMDACIAEHLRRRSRRWASRRTRSS